MSSPCRSGRSPDDALAVHVGTVQAPEVPKDELHATALDDAVLLRNNLVEELDRVGRVAAQRVVHAQLDDLLAFRGRQQQPGHRVARLPSAQRDDKPTAI